MAGQLGLYDCETCPTDCTTQQAPVFTINSCVDAITLYLSEISKIYFCSPDPNDCTQPVAKPSDWTSAPAWADVLSNTEDDKIRYINVIGDIPEPEQQETVMSGGRIKIGNKTYTCNWDVDEINAVNYTASRKLECGYTGFFWYETRGGLLFGGPKGIKANVTKANSPHERGDTAYQKILGQIKWESKCKPEMIVSPITAASC